MFAPTRPVRAHAMHANFKHALITSLSLPLVLSPGCQPASTGPQDTDFPGVEQQKGGDSSLQFLWEREQERERHRAPGQDRDGRIGSARKDIDLQRMQQRGEAQALRAGDSRCDKGLDRLQSPVRPTQRVSETDSRARQEESSFLSPAAGRFAFCSVGHCLTLWGACIMSARSVFSLFSGNVPSALVRTCDFALPADQ